MNRRRWLLGLAAAGLTRPALAIGEGSKLEIAQLKYNGLWDPRPGAARVLAQEVKWQTSIDVRFERAALDVMDERLFYHPFALLLGGGHFRFNAARRSRLKTWIEAGGFLFADNTGRAEPSEAFDASLRSEVAAMFPGRKMIKVPPSHVLFRSFYRLDYPAGRAIHRPFVEGLFLDGRLAIIYSQNDLTGALDRDQMGGWTFDVTPGGKDQRDKAIRMAINVVQYAMCLDYKDDQVHLDFLLHRRRWRIKPPQIEAP